MAEIDANIFGSKVEISGDENKAELRFESCAVGKAIEELGKFTPEQKAKMFEGMQACASKTAKEFGLKAEVRLEKETPVITISK